METERGLSDSSSIGGTEVALDLEQILSIKYILYVTSVSSLFFLLSFL